MYDWFLRGPPTRTSAAVMDTHLLSYSTLSHGKCSVSAVMDTHILSYSTLSLTASALFLSHIHTLLNQLCCCR